MKRKKCEHNFVFDHTENGKTTHAFYCTSCGKLHLENAETGKIEKPQYPVNWKKIAVLSGCY